VSEVPEKGRDGRTGASHRPCPCRGTAWPAGSVLGPSSAVAKCVSLPAIRLINAGQTVSECRLYFSQVVAGRYSCGGAVVLEHRPEPRECRMVAASGASEDRRAASGASEHRLVPARERGGGSSGNAGGRP